MRNIAKEGSDDDGSQERGVVTQVTHASNLQSDSNFIDEHRMKT